MAFGCLSHIPYLVWLSCLYSVYVHLLWPWSPTSQFTSRVLLELKLSPSTFFPCSSTGLLMSWKPLLVLLSLFLAHILLFSTPLTHPPVMSRNTLDRADLSHAVHMTFCTRHRLPAAPSHLGPVPCEWNLSPRFVSLFGLLPYVHFLSHLCLYVT